MNKISLIIVILAISVSRLMAQTWEVPADKKTKVSPFKFTPETVAKGQDIFKKNCSSCHGEPTKGNFQPLVPSPGDPATDKFQKQTDGALFYKITTGRPPMLSFKDVLSEEERWDVISYFRSFNKGYVQPEPETKQSINAALVLLSAVFDDKTHQLKVSITDSVKNPLKETSVSLYVKRYFGNLPIGKPLITANTGMVTFEIPKNIPGDKQGNLEIIFKLANDQYGEIQKSLKLPIGEATDKPPLTQNRAMWNVAAKAPVWLILTYSLVVITIWSFLVYIVFQLIKIRKTSKDNV